MTEIRPNQLYTTAEVAELLPISERQVGNLIRNHSLNGRKVGNYYVVTGRSILNYVENRTIPVAWMDITTNPSYTFVGTIEQVTRAYLSEDEELENRVREVYAQCLQKPDPCTITVMRHDNGVSVQVHPIK